MASGKGGASPAPFPLKTRWRLAVWLWIGLLGALQIFQNRFRVWSDGVSYLDLADTVLTGDWAHAVNACWSPLYAWLLAIVLGMVRPSAYHELLTVKVLGWGLSLAALWTFERLMRSVLRCRLGDAGSSAERSVLSEAGYVVLSYTVFAWTLIVWLLVDREAPDVLLTSLVFLCMSLMLDIVRAPLAWSRYAWLGLTLGLAYLAKSSMLPLAVVFLLVAKSPNLTWRQFAPRIALTTAVIALLAAPWVGLLSAQKGRLTIGDAGRLNYAWYVSPKAHDQFWRGEPAGSGDPVHPPRRLLDRPAVDAFAEPVAGSFPIWFDPSYWNEGLRPRFDGVAQLKVVVKNLRRLLLEVVTPALLGWLALARWGPISAWHPRRWGASGRLWWPALAGIGGYVMFTDISVRSVDWGTLQLRYIAPFVPLVYLGVLAGWRQVPAGAVRGRMKSMGGTARAVVLLTVLAAHAHLLVHAMTPRPTEHIFQPPGQHVAWRVADDLRRLGLHPGDRLAVLGHDGVDGWDEHYWARLGGFKVVATVDRSYGAPDHSAGGEQAQSAANRVLQGLGVKAIVQPPLPPERLVHRLSFPWQPLPTTPAFVRLLGDP